MSQPKNSNQRERHQRKATELRDALLASDWKSLRKTLKSSGSGPAKPQSILLWAKKTLPLSYLRRLAPLFNQLDNLTPADFEAVGKFWHDNECLSEAEQAFRLALSKEPARLDSIQALAGCFHLTGRLDSVRTLLESARAIYPTNTEILAGLANTYLDHHETEQALAAYQLAEEQGGPGASSFGISFLRALAYLPDVTADDLKEAGQDWEQRYAPPAPHPPLPPVTGRIRVGYYSPDFRNHSISYFIRSFLPHHNHDQFEVFLYSDSRFTDSVTDELRSYAHHWRDLTKHSHADAVSLIKKDQLHLLIDLAGHFGNVRPQIFAARPAPIQAHLLGYNGSTGLTSLDYRFSDPISDPPISDPQSSEKIIRLEPGFHCYQQEPGLEIEEGPPPSSLLGHLTFGSFNSAPKLNDLVIETWAQILHALPSSRLLLKTLTLTEQAGKDRFLKRFTSHGIHPDRIDLLPPTLTKIDHLKLYRRLDIALDPFPVNGTTTTCEAFWMGVPVIALLGNRHSARVTSSLLSQIGLPEGICHSREDYVARAVAWAQNPTQLAHWRQSLRSSLTTGPLGDAPTYTAKLEASYQSLLANHS
ncbi:MAG: tetratricopeptide repeat protein [Verrucomicrobiota bacterium]